MSAIVLAADQPSERLREPGPDDPIVERGAAASGAARAMQDRRARPRHLLEDHEAQRMAGYVDAVAQRIGAEQRSAGIVSEDVHQGTGVDRIDVLRKERQARA